MGTFTPSSGGSGKEKPNVKMEFDYDSPYKYLKEHYGLTPATFTPSTIRSNFVFDFDSDLRTIYRDNAYCYNIYQASPPASKMSLFSISDFSATPFEFYVSGSEWSSSFEPIAYTIQYRGITAITPIFSKNKIIWRKPCDASGGHDMSEETYYQRYKLCVLNKQGTILRQSQVIVPISGQPRMHSRADYYDENTDTLYSVILSNNGAGVYYGSILVFENLLSGTTNNFAPDRNYTFESGVAQPLSLEWWYKKDNVLHILPYLYTNGSESSLKYYYITIDLATKQITKVCDKVSGNNYTYGGMNGQGSILSMMNQTPSISSGGSGNYSDYYSVFPYKDGKLYKVAPFYIDATLADVVVDYLPTDFKYVPYINCKFATNSTYGFIYENSLVRSRNDYFSHINEFDLMIPRNYAYNNSGGTAATNLVRRTHRIFNVNKIYEFYDYEDSAGSLHKIKVCDLF